MKKLSFVTVAGVAFLLAGCASNKNPTFAETTMMRSQEAGKIAKDWDAGDKLAKKGEKALRLGQEKQKKAEQLQKEATRLLEDGRQWSARGEAMKADAEARYHEMRAIPVPTGSGS